MWIRMALHAPVVALPLAASLLVTAPVPILLGSAVEPAWDRPGKSAPDSARLSAAVDELFLRWHRPDSPGAAVLVLHRGEVAHSRGYGMANLEHGVPMRTTTVLDIASVSKQLGAAAVAILEAEGELGLDDPIRRYLPELPDWGEEVTIRHLVHHTSGIRDWPGTLGMGGWDFQDVISFQQILRMAEHQEDLNFPPGSDYAYSNTGYNLLAEVVARVTGMSFREWSDQRIFRPLGMTRTHVHDDHTEVIPDRADSYAPRPEGGYRRITNNLTALASSSVHTTVEDLAHWVENFRDPVVGGPAVMERMHERGVLTGGDTIAYAFGQLVEIHRGATRVTHTGSWAGFRSALHRFPELDFAVIILANTADMNPAALAGEIAGLYLADELDPEPMASAVPAGTPAAEEGAGRWTPSAPELAPYEGTYQSRELDTTYRLRVVDGTLTAHHFRTGARALSPSGLDRFQAAGMGEVRFLRNQGGEITGFTANSDRIRNLRFTRIP